MNNEEARKLYKESGLTYANISSIEISKLIDCIKHELSNSDNELEMKLSKLRKSDITYNSDGTIKNCYLMVDGFYFKRREAISFNSADVKGNEFIGFAGWAGSKNTKPFIVAFEKWLTRIILK